MNSEFPYKELRSSIGWVYKQMETDESHIPRPLKPRLRPKEIVNSKIINLMYWGG
jgi:hypothetical protein